MNELTILYLVTFIAGVLGPLMTRSFLLQRSRAYSRSYAAAIIIIIIAAVIDTKALFIAWPLFCAFGLLLGAAQFLRERQPLFQIGELIPFVFSIISSVWFFSATNDLHLLGYNVEWSLYAAIHSAFFGWIFNGSLVKLYRVTGERRYLIAVYINLILFLSVAFGIDGSPTLKKIGAIGVSLAVPISIGMYVFAATPKSRASRVLGYVSFSAVILSMAIAVMNEFFVGFPQYTLGIPTMVWSHGLLNALVAVPSFFFAVYYRSKEQG
jgi:hypothetical protein